MPVATSASTSRRLLGLLSLLQTERDWPAPVLAARLGISARTVRRDIERLRELDYAIDTTRGPDGGYRLAAGSRLPPLLLDDEQAVACAIALRSAAGGGAGIEEAADRALRSIRRLLPDRLARRIDAIAFRVSTERMQPVDAETLLRIGEAVRDRRELRFDYRSPDRAEDPARPPRRIEPHHLVLREGRWYVIGYAPERAEWRVYRADRMDLKTHTGRGFEVRPLPGGDPDAFLSARFRGSESGRWPCEGAATLAAPFGEIAPYAEPGAVEAVGEDRCRVRLGAWSWAGLAASFARFDAELSEVEPAELREAFRGLALRAAAAGG